MPEDGGARVLRTLGLALRGGHVAVGTRAVRDAAAEGELELVVLAGDASRNATGRIRGVLDDPGIPAVRCADGDALGRALGRSRVVVAGLTDPGLARKLARDAEGRGGPGRGNTPRSQGNDGSAAGGDRPRDAAVERDATATILREKT